MSSSSLRDSTDNKSFGNNNTVVSSSSSSPISFKKGDKIQVEVRSFGPLGASVDVIAHNHDPNSCIPEFEPALAKGLIVQREIHYFRARRQNVDLVLGEVVPAYVERVRLVNTSSHDKEGVPQQELRLDVALREIGCHAKATDITDQILQILETKKNGVLNVGDKSSANEIAAVFPGVSKSVFKRAVSILYKAGKVTPGPYSVSLVKSADTVDN